MCQAVPRDVFEMSAVRQRKVNIGKKGLAKKHFEFKPLDEPRDASNYSNFTFLRQLIRNVFEFLLDREEDEIQGVRVFPKSTIFIIMLFTFWSRKNIMNSRESWWMMHPDEVYQSIEVAHSEVYGYGFRPYEYLSPPRAPDDAVQSSIAESQRSNLGMYSLRSWMLPRIYIILFQLKEYFQWTETPYKLARIFHAMVASTLPFIIYKLSRRVFGGNRDAACVAATFVAFSKPLLLLQTRTFVHSLLAPFVWLAITFLVSLVQSNTTTFSLRTTSSAFEIISVTACGAVLGLTVYIRVDTSALLLLSGVFLVFSFPKWAKCLRMLCPLAFGALLGTVYGGFYDSITYGQWFISPKQWLRFQLRYASRIFGRDDFFFYLRHVVFTNHTFYVLVPISLVITAYYIHRRKELHNQYSRCNYPQEDITGTNIPTENRPMPSEIVQVKQQVTQKGHGNVTQDEQQQMPNTSSKIHLRWGAHYAPILEGTCKTTLMTLFLFLLYSCQPHKEVRFVHDALVGLMICCGGTTYIVFRAVYEKAIEASAPPMSIRRIMKLVLYTELLLFAFDSRLNLPASRDKTNRPWTYAGLYDSGDVNQCLDFVSKQPDVTGVFIDYSVHMTGGYALLHRDVPIFAKTHFEFREWCLEKRVAYPGFLLPGASNVSIATIDDICDFISVLNAKYALKRLVEQTKYNYVVITGDTQFLKKGFRKVFNSSDAVVFKRTSHKTEVEYLEDLGRQISMTSNATVLEYEASWLLTLNQPGKALERLENAIKMDKNRVKVWQLMVTALKMLGNLDAARNLADKCYELHGKVACSKTYPKVVLHKEYLLDISD